MVELKNNMKKLFMPLLRSVKGFALLYMVLIMGAIMLGLLLSFAAIGIGSLRTSQSMSSGAGAGATASGCAEYALNYLRSNKNWTGTNTISLVGGSCQYAIANTGGNTRQLEIVGTRSNYTKKMRITVTALTPRIVIGAWQEISN